MEHEESVAERYRRLSERLVGTVAAVPADAWDRLSHCEGWTALDLVGQLVDVAVLISPVDVLPCLGSTHDCVASLVIRMVR